MKNKKRSGVTLLELVIAVFVLILIAGPMFGLYLQATQQNILGHKISLATFYAQQKIEEFVGLNLTEIAARIDEPENDPDYFPPGVMGKAVPLPLDDSNFYAEAQFLKSPNGDADLLLVRVSVYNGADALGDLLCTQENYLLINASST